MGEKGLQFTNMSVPQRSSDPLAHLNPAERNLFDRFLVLIRDNYRKAEKAAHFLERKTHTAPTCSMANLRDVLSHMSTLLDPSTPEDKRQDQLADAEEHLRRAIVEPYELALGDINQKFRTSYGTYREKVIPIRDETEGFRSAPTRADIESRLQDIEELTEKAKSAKGRNRWDEEWELGIEALVEAYRQSAELHAEVEGWVYKFNQHSATQSINSTSGSLRETSTHHTRLHKWAIAWAIVGIVLGLGGGYLFARYAGYLAVPVASKITTNKAN
jgi:hypothetical protein